MTVLARHSLGGEIRYEASGAQTSLRNLRGTFVTRGKPRKSLQALVASLDRPGLSPAQRAKKVERFKKKVTAQVGKSLTPAQAQVLVFLIDAL